MYDIWITYVRHRLVGDHAHCTYMRSHVPTFIHSNTTSCTPPRMQEGDGGEDWGIRWCAVWKNKGESKSERMNPRKIKWRGRAEEISRQRKNCCRDKREHESPWFAHQVAHFSSDRSGNVAFPHKDMDRFAERVTFIGNIHTAATIIRLNAEAQDTRRIHVMTDVMHPRDCFYRCTHHFSDHHRCYLLFANWSMDKHNAMSLLIYT